MIILIPFTKSHTHTGIINNLPPPPFRPLSIFHLYPHAFSTNTNFWRLHICCPRRPTAIDFPAHVPTPPPAPALFPFPPHRSVENRDGPGRPCHTRQILIAVKFSVKSDQSSAAMLWAQPWPMSKVSGKPDDFPVENGKLRRGFGRFKHPPVWWTRGLPGLRFICFYLTLWCGLN